MRVALLDYRLGNLTSVTSALSVAEIDVIRTSQPVVPGDVDALILPGVANFAEGMNNLTRSGQFDLLSSWRSLERPILGLCLGAQLLLDGSEESPGVLGLGFISGSSVRLNKRVGRVPNQGWLPVEMAEPVSQNSVSAARLPLLYFSHSFEMNPESPSDVGGKAVLPSGHKIIAAIRRDNLAGLQFHPERSGHAGIKLLKSTLEAIVSI